MANSTNSIQLPIPSNEADRLCSLQSYEMMGKAGGADLDDLAKLAAILCDSPAACISLIDEKQQWFVSRFGVDLKGSSRDISFCQYTIMNNEIFQVENAFEDNRFRNNELVVGFPNICFYAGVPLYNSQEVAIGTLFVFDTKPNALNDSQKEGMMILAKNVVLNLELIRNKLNLEKINKELERRVKVRTAELEVSNEELGRTNFELDSFIYRASHDLRGPLCNISGLVNIAKKQNSAKSLFDFIDKIGNVTLKLDDVLNDLVDYSNNNRKPLAIQPVNFEKLIHECIENNSYLRGAAELTIEKQILGESLFCSDDERLRIIFSNLISNAISFQKPFIENPYLKITIHIDLKEANIIFQDNGEGIPPDRLDKIFEMFYRGSVRSQGSGLGLYIVKEVVRKLNGKIDFQSTLGEGTEIRLCIPNHAAGESNG